MTNPKWITIAEKYIGLAEIPGSKHNSTIKTWLTQLKAWWSDDETPWCGTFVAHCIVECGLPKAKNWFRAMGWKDYGRAVPPTVGAILVFSREGGGHVGFYVGEDAARFLVLGGNQGNKVSKVWIAKNRMVACRWPSEVPVPNTGKVVMSGGGPTSTNEA